MTVPTQASVPAGRGYWWTDQPAAINPRRERPAVDARERSSHRPAAIAIADDARAPQPRIAEGRIPPSDASLASPETTIRASDGRATQAATRWNGTCPPRAVVGSSRVGPGRRNRASIQSQAG